ncbi:MAG: cytochrome b5-like heme/steroid binding domain-containing protein [archaeon]
MKAMHLILATLVLISACATTETTPRPTTAPTESEQIQIIVPDAAPNEESEPEMQDSTVTMANLSEHDTPEDCWVGFEGNAYDITDYVSRHPGGIGAISEHCGTESDFMQAFFAQHGDSKVGKLMQEGMVKGDLTG